VDRAAQTGLDFVHFNGRSGKLFIGEVMGSGAALFDYDGDGDLDAFLVQGDRLGPGEDYEAATPPPREGDRPPRDRLFRNLLAESGELRFEDVTEASGITGTGYGMGAAVGDVDGDGDPDLYVTALGGNRLWVNRGDGTFEDATAASRSDDPRWSTSASFFDADLDGDLDLWVGNYLAWTAATAARCLDAAGQVDYCGPLSYPPVADRLLENRGDGTFVNVSSPTRVRFSFGAALGVLAVDLTGDPRPEVYVANDASANQLWTPGGAAGEAMAAAAWQDLALERGCALDGAGRPEGSMGVDAGDYDGDGDLDLFVAHVHRETNTLYANDGDGGFTDATRAAGLAAPSLGMTGFGAGFLDYDNDGWLDLLVVNGSVNRIPALAAAGDPWPLHQTDQLFRNLGRGGDGAVRFADVSATAGEAFTVSRVSRGAAFGDVDGDGDTDVLVNDSGAPARLLINQVGHRSHWLGLRLRGGPGGGDDPGARVTVETASGRRLLRRVRVDGSYLSAHDPRVLVGLGDETAVRAAQVRWADGTLETFPLAGRPVDRYVELVRGTAPKPGTPAAEP
jgi:hypothetical protein